jgi:hypothetical protein
MTVKNFKSAIASLFCARDFSYSEIYDLSDEDREKFLSSLFHSFHVVRGYCLQDFPSNFKYTGSRSISKRQKRRLRGRNRREKH